MQTMEVDTWANYKTLLASKSLTIQYGQSATWYELFAPEATTFLWHISVEKGTADATDFETNYKPTANAPMMVAGFNPSVPAITEQQLFNALAIRDTVGHDSAICPAFGYPNKTIIIDNSLNQDVTFVAYGSRDQTTWISLGFTWTVAAGTSNYQTCGTYFPYGKIVATCAVAPASGTLSLWIEKLGI